MSDDLSRLLSGVDAPRALPPELRDRLERRLLEAGTRSGADEPVQVSPDLRNRLEAALTDPVAGVLDGVDDARPLPTDLRERLARELVGARPAAPAGARRHQRMVPAWLGAAAAVAALLVGAVVLIRPGASTPRESSAGPSSTFGAPPGAATPNPALPAVPAPQAAKAAGGSAASAGSAADATAGRDTGGVAGYGGAPLVSVSGLSPQSGPTSGGTTVTITGNGLRSAVGVFFGNHAAASYRVVSDHRMTVTTPSAPAGVVDVKIHTRDGRIVTLRRAFTYRG